MKKPIAVLGLSALALVAAACASTIKEKETIKEKDSDSPTIVEHRTVIERQPESVWVPGTPGHWEYR